MKTILFNKIERAIIISDSFTRYGANVPSLHSDFLALNSVNGYFETDKYYFFTCLMYGVREVRFWKKSKRVSISEHPTFVPAHPICYGDWIIANRGSLLQAYNFKKDYFINPLFIDWDSLKAKIDSL